MNLIKLYIDVEDIQDFTQKFAKIALAQYYASARKKKEQQRIRNRNQD